MNLFNVFDNLSALLYIGAAIVTIIGLARLYYLWNTDRNHDIDKEIYLWVGGIILFLVSATVAKALFY